MKIRSFIGKSVFPDKIQSIASYYCAGEYDERYAIAEIYLCNFGCDGFVDKTGRNAYSIQQQYFSPN